MVSESFLTGVYKPQLPTPAPDILKDDDGI